MAEGLWIFWIYSFLGYGLEKGFAAVTRASHRVRKCRLFLPLCPVYGWGMLAVLALPESWQQGGWAILSGGIAATAVEYAVHWWYETVLGVAFWDYSDLPANLGGRVCLPFAAIWGILTAAAVIWIHPMVLSLVARVPAEVTVLVLVVFVIDSLYSARFLWRTKQIDALRGAGIVRRMR